MGEGQRERETQNQKQAPGSELSAQSPTRGLNSQSESGKGAEREGDTKSEAGSIL